MIRAVIKSGNAHSFNAIAVLSGSAAADSVRRPKGHRKYYKAMNLAHYHTRIDRPKQDRKT